MNVKFSSKHWDTRGFGCQKDGVAVIPRTCCNTNVTRQRFDCARRTDNRRGREKLRGQQINLLCPISDGRYTFCGSEVRLITSRANKDAELRSAGAGFKIIYQSQVVAYR